jgi:acyl carrier protein
MTTAPHTPALAAPLTPAADVLAELTAVLAGLLRIEAHTVDAGQSFAYLGLDSMHTAEFVSALNARYGTRIQAGALYGHPTPAALARHVAAELGTPAPAAPAVPAPAAPVSVVPVPVSGPEPARPAADPDAVTGALREQLARILRCGPADIDARAPFTLLGLDSILAAEFVAGINRTYGLTEQAALLYDHPDLTAMAAYVTSRVTGAPAAPPAGPVPDPKDTPYAPGPDLNALLDAVRDDVLSIDEAAALLTARSA